MITIKQELTGECWKGGNKKQFIIVHHTGSSKNTTFQQIVSFFKRRDYVSVHYVVGKKGEITQMVEDNDRAWHAGVSEWDGVKSLNHYSIGIEVLSDGENYTMKQREAVLELCRVLVKKYNISIEKVLRHADIAPKRKWDVGPEFYVPVWGTWHGFQNAILHSSNKETIKNLEKKHDEIGRNVSSVLAALNDVVKNLSYEKGVPYIPYKLTRD